MFFFSARSFVRYQHHFSFMLLYFYHFQVDSAARSLNTLCTAHARLRRRDRLVNGWFDLLIAVLHIKRLDRRIA